MTTFKNIKFRDNDFELEIDLFLKENKVYLSIYDMAKLFDRSRATISKHIKNIYKEELFIEETTCAKFEHMVPNLGRKYETTYYNLDIVISVGYRVKSNRGLLLKKLLNGNIDYKHYEIENSNIIIFDNGTVHIPVEVSKKEQTIWATETQIADVYEVSRQTINYHINNILKDNELELISARKEILQPGVNGKQFLTTFYNLDMVLAIGYRVNSKVAIAFRRWATSVLSDIIKQGYSINEERCIECQSSIIGLQNRIIELEKNQDKVLTFYPGDELKGLAAVERLLRSAKKEIIIVDNYFGHDFDSVLSEINVEKVIITNPKNTKIETNENYRVIKINEFHDRYIIVDDICFLFGQSPGKLGEKISSSGKIRDKVLIDAIKTLTRNIIVKK